MDVQPILADGLSATACMQSGVALLNAFKAACERRNPSTGAKIQVPASKAVKFKAFKVLTDAVSGGK